MISLSLFGWQRMHRVPCRFSGGILLEQRSETRLLKMVIACERIADALVFHDNKRDAVGERPVFVRAGGHEVEAPLHQGRVQHDYPHPGARTHPGDERQEISVIRRAGACIAEFQKDELRGDQHLIPSGRRQSEMVRRIIFPKQGEIKERVGKDHVHGFFGSPLM